MRFGNILSNQPIHVFISTYLPSSKGMSKVKIGPQSLGNQLLFCKFLIIFYCNGMHMIRHWFQKINNGQPYLLSCAIVHFTQQGKLRFPFRESNYSLSAPFTNNGIRLPVSRPFAFSHNGWSFLDAHSVRQLAPSTITAVSLATFLLES